MRGKWREGAERGVHFLDIAIFGSMTVSGKEKKRKEWARRGDGKLGGTLNVNGRDPWYEKQSPCDGQHGRE